MKKGKANIFSRLCVAVFFFCFASGVMAGEWIADEKGCKAWDANPDPGEVIEWTGACKDGYLDGPGILRWYSKDTKPTWYRSGKPVETHEGNWLAGKMNGKFVNTYASGNRYEGDRADDKKSGKGIFTWANGDRYDGDWADDKRSGKGVFLWANRSRYEGGWADDRKNGYGVEQYSDGDKFEGVFLDGSLKDGNVRNTSDTGVYVGSIKDGMKEGKGTFVWKNGDRYEGEFVKSKMSVGTKIYVSGDRYEGTFEDGEPHGRGEYKYASGARYEGDFEKGLRSGQGRYIWADGSSYQGDWNKGHKKGKGKYSSKDRLIYEGDFVDDDFNGFGDYYYSNAKYTGYMKNDKPNGRGKLLMASGNVAEGNFVNGNREGDFLITFTDGSTDVQKFRNDKFVSSQNQRSAQGIAALALVFGAIGKVAEGVGNAINSAASSSGSGYSAPSYPTCQYRDEDCFKIIETKWDDKSYTDYYIQCTKGKSTGRKECISYWKGDGTWKDGCGITSYYRYDRRKAGNWACGEY